MTAKPLPVNAVAAVALRHAFTHPSYWLPALLLLSPTFVLPLIAPTYLRRRLAPSAWTVAAGAVLLVWLAQVALPAVSALVHCAAKECIAAWTCRWFGCLSSLAHRVTLGLIVAVLPGLWLQPRYAFAPLLTRLGQEATACGCARRAGGCRL